MLANLLHLLPAWVWKVLLLVLWLTAAATGFFLLTQYKNTGGPTAEAPLTWPTDSLLPRKSQRPTLLLFLHPHCDCSHATLSELKQLLTSIEKPPQTYVLFYHPSSMTEEWCRTSLYEQAKNVPHVQVLLDSGERERQRFGAITSGQALLYDAKGQLRYNGGMTRARGIVGDNPGRQALHRLLLGEKPLEPPTPVLGCPIVSKGDCKCQP